MKILFDLEADGFLDTITKIHCVSYTNLEKDDGNITTLVDMDDIRSLFASVSCVVGHHVVGYDIPALSKVLGVEIKCDIIDTLPLAWYLLPTRRKSYGLADFGTDYGIKKPEIDDWEGLTQEEYVHRCEEDVKINLKLWKDLSAKLDRLYMDDQEARDRVMWYLTFKMQLAQKQEQQCFDIDVAGAESLYTKLEGLIAEKFETLSDAMPEKINYKTKAKPKVFELACGSVSAKGQEWYDFLDGQGLARTRTEPVEYVDSTERGNPNSTPQIKDWLFSLGWRPQTWKFTRNVKGVEKKVPQVRTEDKELCPSVLELASNDPAIELLDGYSVLVHRLNIVKSFLKYAKDGKLQARVHGLTNTFRFKHVAPLVNLPGVDKPWGKEIRGLLRAPDGELLCGADMVSLEDTTKRHYMTPHDPEYCKLMDCKDWDPHLDLAKFAGAITDGMIAAGGQEVQAIRKSYKAANYASVYGVGARTLSRATGLSERAAAQLIEAYWERNWAVKEVVNNIETKKTLTGSKSELQWVRNPISGFWHHLRTEKDIWSTINQSSGVYCFDRWVYHLTRREVWPIAQFHDEVVVVSPFDKHQAEELEYDLEQAMVDTNAELKLNVELAIDVQFGDNYANIH